MSALRPYHQFLGNGIDAVLIGPTGSMVADAAQGLDRCYWYKSDTYYADARLFRPGDDPRAFQAAPPGGTNFQLAPLGRAWFAILDPEGRPVQPEAISQQFAPETGILYTTARYADIAVQVRTVLAADLPALLFDLSAEREIAALACVAPGLWPEDREQVEPTSDRVALDGALPGWRYRVGAHRCRLLLVPELGAQGGGVDDARAWLRLCGRRLRWWAVLECSRYPSEEGAWQRLPNAGAAEGGDALDSELGAGTPGGLKPTLAAPRGHDALPGMDSGVSRSFAAMAPEEEAGDSEEDHIPDAESGGIACNGDHPHPTAVGVALPCDRSRRSPQAGSIDIGLAVAPQLDLPDEDYQRLHAFSMYMFRAMQHRESGGLPVNNLRRTFNSHVFWDGAFVQRALLEAGHVAPAREAWRFLARTRDAAAASARDTFRAPGLHWDWETTHRGERAYVPWMQQRFQVHNTPLLAHMVMADYRATRDRAVLEEGYDLLSGAATFVLHAVLTEEGGRLVTRPLVGSHEAARPVVNDGATVAASLRLLLDVAQAARLLGRHDAFARRCALAAHALRRTLDDLFNGRYLRASRDEDRLNTSSLAPLYPAEVVAPADPRALATTAAYLRLYPGRMVGHGNNAQGFPWSAGILARLLAYQGRADAAWQQMDLARAALCAQGGCAEYVDADGRWNLQYFSTAQAALCSALHALLVQVHGPELHLFPALPAHWARCSFRDFLVNGLRVDARFERGAATVSVRNDGPRPRRLRVRFGARQEIAVVGAGDRRTLELESRDDRA